MVLFKSFVEFNTVFFEEIYGFFIRWGEHYGFQKPKRYYVSVHFSNSSSKQHTYDMLHVKEMVLYFDVDLNVKWTSLYSLSA